MSRVTLTTVSPGDATTITAPNDLQDGIQSALLQVNQENIREGGIDKRNISFPVCTQSGSVYHNQRTAVSSTAGTWTTFPATGFSLSVSMTDCHAAIVRVSGEVRLNGTALKTTTTAGSEQPPWMGVRLLERVDGVPASLPHTQRHFQLGRDPDESAAQLLFPCTFEFHITHLIDNRAMTDTSNRTFSLEYRMKDPPSKSTSGGGTIGFLNGHIQKYKG
jgi:hypothetical protein